MGTTWNVRRPFCSIGVFLAEIMPDSHMAGRTDTCLICWVWDSDCQQNVCKWLREATGALLKEEASYFAGFNAFAIEDCPTDSASLQALMRFIEAKRTEAAELQSVEAVILTELKGEAGDNGLIALLEHFELHWRIRDVQRDAHRRHRTQPEPRVLYLLWDFKDINRC